MDLKALLEKRALLISEMENIVNASITGTEFRALTDTEQTDFNSKKTEVESLDKTIASIEAQRELAKTVPAKQTDKTVEETETRAFEAYLKNELETRADVNMTTGDNGAIIPSTIANKIIAKVYDISPIYQLATKYNVKGALNIPYYDESTNAITMTYADEFTSAESSIGKFTSITLTGFLGRCLSLVSLTLITEAGFDLVSYVIGKMAESIAIWIEKELIKGTTSKITGLASGVTQKVTAASATAITADELIDLQEKVPDVYQANAVWIMSKATRTAIRKLKDGDGQYLLNKDATAKWGYTLFGKDVYVSKSVDDIAASKDVVYYGDFSGLAVKLSENLNIQVLREKYAEQHCVGVLGFVSLDAKVENAQKLAKLTTAAAAG